MNYLGSLLFVGFSVRLSARFVLKSALYLFGGAILAGLVVWLATVKTEDFYLRSAFKADSIANIWMRPSLSKTSSHQPLYHQATLSAWLNSTRAAQAFENFDDWIQEYLLALDETSETADDEAQILPPVPMTPDQDTSPASGVEVQVDPYDRALGEFVRGVWESGFLTVAGSLHLDVPLWAKPLSGWFVVANQSRFSPYILEKILNHLGAREDGADLVGWLNTLPFAYVSDDGKESVVHEIVMQLSGENISELLSRLCEMGNLSERLCSDEDLEDNPLRPILFATENFQLPLNLFWTLSGEHVVWSNSRPCLLSLIAQGANPGAGCGDSPSVVAKAKIPEKTSFMSLKRRPYESGSPSVGYWGNQLALERAMRDVFTRLSAKDVRGASWAQDFLLTAGGESFRDKTLATLSGWAFDWSFWGAQLHYIGVDSGRLMTYAKCSQGSQPRGTLARNVSATQFEFLNALMSAWLGLPRSTARLSEAKPWESTETCWQAESVYRLGWSEQ